MDFVREGYKMESDELREFAEKIAPFVGDHLHNLVTILDNDDLIRLGKWSLKTLSERYKDNLVHLLAAEPKREGSSSRTAKIEPQ